MTYEAPKLCRIATAQNPSYASQSPRGGGGVGGGGGGRRKKKPILNVVQETPTATTTLQQHRSLQLQARTL